MGLTTASEFANRAIGTSGSKVQESSAKLALGKAFTKASQDAAGSAIEMKLEADKAGLRQASKNASQGAALIQSGDAAYEKTLNELIRMRELATQVNNAALQTEERAQANAEFAERLAQIDRIASTTRFGELELLGGGGGSASLHSATAAVAEAITGGVASANALPGTLNAATNGYITGSVDSISVVDAAAGSYTVTMQVGDQTFEGTTTPAIAGVLTLTSTGPAGNVIALDYDGTAITGITSAGTLQAALTTSFGNASLTSASADISGIANSYDTATFAVTSSTGPGSYALSYNSANTTFTLSDEAGNSWNEVVTASAGTAQSVTFGNGVSFSTVAGFVGTADFAQITFGVSAGTNVSLDFQTSTKATDISNVTFTAATTASLGLSNATIATVPGAVTALDNISTAINSLNIARAGLGAAQSGFESTIALNAVQSENLGEIQGTFTNLDYAAEQTKMQEANVKMQASISVAAMNNQNMQLMLKLLN